MLLLLHLLLLLIFDCRSRGIDLLLFNGLLSVLYCSSGVFADCGGVLGIVAVVIVGFPVEGEGLLRVVEDDAVFLGVGVFLGQ